MTVANVPEPFWKLETLADYRTRCDQGVSFSGRAFQRGCLNGEQTRYVGTRPDGIAVVQTAF